MHNDCTIVIADDHPLVRGGLRQAIENDGRYTILAEAADGVEALEQIRTHKPRIVILDIQMPRRSGLDVVAEIDREGLPVLPIILTMHNDEEMFKEALDLGVRGYILKDSASRDIMHCIRAVERGDYYLSPALSNVAMKSRESNSAVSDRTLLLHRLSPTERRILTCIAQDMQTAEIADRFSISHRTVDAHRAHICQKLNLSGVYALVRFALQHRSAL